MGVQQEWYQDLQDEGQTWGEAAIFELFLHLIYSLPKTSNVYLQRIKSTVANVEVIDRINYKQLLSYINFVFVVISTSHPCSMFGAFFKHVKV